jgi:Flp pilus assembly protein TadD
MSLEKHEAYEIYTRAEGHYRAGNLEEALRELDALLDSFPDEPRLINAKALCLQKLGRAIEVQHAFERLRQLPEKKVAQGIYGIQIRLATVEVMKAKGPAEFETWQCC